MTAWHRPTVTSLPFNSLTSLPPCRRPLPSYRRLSSACSTRSPCSSPAAAAASPACCTARAASAAAAAGPAGARRCSWAPRSRQPSAWLMRRCNALVTASCCATPAASVNSALLPACCCCACFSYPLVPLSVPVPSLRARAPPPDPSRLLPPISGRPPLALRLFLLHALSLFCPSWPSSHSSYQLCCRRLCNAVVCATSPHILGLLSDAALRRWLHRRSGQGDCLSGCTSGQGARQEATSHPHASPADGLCCGSPAMQRCKRSTTPEGSRACAHGARVPADSSTLLQGGQRGEVREARWRAHWLSGWVGAAGHKATACCVSI